MPPSRHHTLAEDRIPWREKIGFGLGEITVAGSVGTLHVLVNPIYNMVLGMNPALISTVVFIQRFWDALLDPLLGQFSDNFRSRWGRRRPLIAAAAVPLALLFALLWWFPQGAGDTGLFLHLLLVSLAFYAAHTLFAIPLFGLRIEATPDYHERTRIVSIVMIFGFAFQITSQWLFPVVQLPYFGDTVAGLRWVTGACAAVFVLGALAPVFLCRERGYARVAGRQPKISLRDALRHVRENPPLLRVAIARLIQNFGYNMVGMLGIYMNAYYVFGGDLKAAAWAYGFLGSSYMVSAIVCSMIIYPWLARRLGKRRTFQIAAGILMVGCLSKLVIYHPGLPWLQFIVLITNGAANSGIGLMGMSMIADIADYNEWRTGQRNEAFLAAIMNWCDKTGGSLGSLLCGFILVWIGFDAKLGAQSAFTLQLMKFSYFALPFTGAVVAFWLMRRYDLDEDRVYAIKDELARRHALASTAAPAPALPV
ncbi:MAG TPA: MFS transporter [Opitutaceae bacterium]